VFSVEERVKSQELLIANEYHEKAVAMIKLEVCELIIYSYLYYLFLLYLFLKEYYETERLRIASQKQIGVQTNVLYIYIYIYYKVNTEYIKKIYNNN
jgi:hypothetical protein